MAADKKEAASKQEALENALKKIEKDFGKGSIMRLGDAKAHMDIEVIPTGILPLDIALGVGGMLFATALGIFLIPVFFVGMEWIAAKLGLLKQERKKSSADYM